MFTALSLPRSLLEVRSTLVLIICLQLVSCKTVITTQYSWVSEKTNIERQASDEKECKAEGEGFAGKKPRKEPEVAFRPEIGRGVLEAGGKQRNLIALEEWENKNTSQYEKCMMGKGYTRAE